MGFLYFCILLSDIFFPPDLQTDKCGSLHKISTDYYDSEGITTLKTFAVLQEKLYKRHCKYGKMWVCSEHFGDNLLKTGILYVILMPVEKP